MLISTCLAPTVYADSLTWTGSGDGTSWSDGGNWSGGSEPTSAETVWINSYNGPTIGAALAATATKLSVGTTDGGIGSLTISNGGSLSIGHNLLLGDNYSGATGYLTISDGSSIAIGGALVVGQSGTGIVSIESGSSIRTSSFLIGNMAGGNGQATVTGAGSTVEIGSHLYIGRNGPGTLTVSDGGTVSASGVLSIAMNSGFTGALNIGAASGDIAVAPGIVTASSGIVFGTGTGRIVFNHTSSDYVFSNSISGAGTIEADAGITYLTGDLSGFTGAFDIAGGALGFSPSRVQTLSNSFSGSSGALSFTSGTTYLTGDGSGYTSTTSVSGTGILSVNGTLGGAVDVASGGTLKGSGTVGGVAVASGGAVAPGNSIGTLYVSGNVSFAPGSTYDVEANASSSDKIVASGSGSITGGAVRVIPYQGALIPAGTSWSILSAAGGVSGSFDDVSFISNSLFLTATLAYDATDVTASIVRNNTRFASMAGSGNQARAAAAIESLGAGNSLYDAISWQSDAATARQAYQALNGEIHANIKASVLEDQSAMSRILASRMAQSQDADGFAGSPGQTPSVAQQTRFDSSQNARDRRMMARAPYGDTLVTDKPAPTPTRYDPAIWAQGFGDWGHRDGDASAGAFKHQNKGLMTGIDWMMGDKWRTGLAFGYQHADYKQDDFTGATGRADRYSLSAYGGRSWGKLSLRTGVTYAYSDIDTTRGISFPYFSDYLKASYEAHSVSGFGEAAYWFGNKDTKAEPFANLAYGYVNVPGFSEKGGAAALTAKDSTDTLGTTTLGVRLRQTLSFLEMAKNKAAIRALAGWMHAIGDVNPETSLRFAGSSAFKAQSAPLARDAAVLGAGVDYLIGDQTTLGVAYTGQVGKHADTQAVRGNVSYRF